MFRNLFKPSPNKNIQSRKNEQKVIAQTKKPSTVSSLVSDLKKLGITHGDDVIVHVSMSKIGWVCGGTQTVIEALLSAVGSGGTIIMPAQTTDNSDPAEWLQPSIDRKSVV